MAAVPIVNRVEAHTRVSRSRQRLAQRWMLPKEPAAYSAFMFPVFTVLAFGRPTPEAWLLTVAAFALFLSHEPMSVVFGVRGERAERQRGTTAWRLLVLHGVAALGFGIGGLWLAQEPVHYAAMAALVLAWAGFMLSAEGLGKTVPGQMVMVSALAFVALPVGLACGLSFVVSMYVVAVWILVGTLGASVVGLNVDRARRRAGDDLAKARLRAATALGVCLLIISGAIAAPFAILLPLWVLAAAWPTALAAAMIVLVGPRPGRLRTMGWVLLGANACTWLMVVGALYLEAGVSPSHPGL